MEILEGRGRVAVLEYRDVRVTSGPPDRAHHRSRPAVHWSAVITDGTKAIPRLGHENTIVGHPFVAIASTDRLTRIRGHEHL
jgi:hypothetical protein